MILPPDDKKEPEHEASTSTLHPSEPPSSATAHDQVDVHASRVQHGVQSTAAAPGRILTTSDEPNEETRLLPPPSYSEAVANTGKAGKRRRLRYLAIGLFVIVFTGVAVGAAVIQRKQRETRHEWKRGGLDGKGELHHSFAENEALTIRCPLGKFDHRWQHRTPFLTNSPTLSNESDPRECDLFSEPRLIDSWRNGATALPIYESKAEYLFSINDYTTAAASLESLWVHVRGSKAYGGVHVLGPGTEVIEIERPPTGKVKIAIRITAENTTTLNDWHCCRAGGEGKQGIVLVGPNDGSRPVASPWLEGYMKFQVDIIFPFEVSGRSRYILESLAMIMENMGVTFTGDLQSVALAKTVLVATTNAAVAVTTVSQRIPPKPYGSD